MNNVKKILFYAIPILMCGCIPIMSIDPFYTDSDVVINDKIIGTWIDDVNEPDTTWIFSRNEEEPNTYQLTFSDQDKNKGSYQAVLIKLENTLFLDIYPDTMPWGEDEDSNDVEFAYNTFFIVPAHTILKVDSIEPQLLLRLTETSKFEELLEEHPGEIEYQEGKESIVLKSSTKELQKFILKYIEDERMFPGKVNLTRKEQ